MASISPLLCLCCKILTTSLIVLVCAWLGAKRLTLQWCWIETHKVWCLTGELKSIRWLKAATEYKALNLESKVRSVSSPEHLFLFGLLVFYVWYNRIHGLDGAESESHGFLLVYLFVGAKSMKAARSNRGWTDAFSYGPSCCHDTTSKDFDPESCLPCWVLQAGPDFLGLVLARCRRMKKLSCIVLLGKSGWIELFS